jgi:hypothetical protein
MNSFRVISGLFGICITGFFILLIGLVQPVNADTTTAQLEQPWKIISATPIGYPGEQEYRAHLQIVVRDENNQLISVTESITIWRIPTFFPDGEPAPLWLNSVFYNTLKKNHQTTIIDGIHYEKVEYNITPHLESRAGALADSYLWLCANVQVYGELCMKSFYARAAMGYLEAGDVRTEKWTILRQIS